MISLPNKNIFFILLLGFLLATTQRLTAQTNRYLIDKKYNDLSLQEFIKKVENQYDCRFFYEPQDLPKLIINVQTDSVFLDKLLPELLDPYNVKLSIDHRGNIFLIKDHSISTSLPDGFFDVLETHVSTQIENITTDKAQASFMIGNDEYIAKTIIIGTRKAGILIDKARITGYIKNAEDGSPVINAALYIEETSSGTTTNEQGYFNLILPKGKYTVVVSNIEFETVKLRLEVLSGGAVDIMMMPKSYLLDEVVISSEQNHNVRGSQMGFEKLTMERIKEIPMVLGEKDIIKVALLLPGIQSVGEGSSGFNVRGSPVDQNIFYLNQIPVYNTSHCLGFFSAFNADVIKEFSLYKSNIPLHYGGRLSSIFDISAKEGNKQKFSARGGISPITGRFMIEGPFKKGKSSYLVGIRSTYSNWLLDLIDDPNISSSLVKFGDAVVGLSLHLNEKNRLELFSYGSYDRIKIASKTAHYYENLGASLSWKHFFNNKHDLKLGYIHSEYYFDEENQELDIAAYKQSYRLKHDEFKADLTFRLSDYYTLTTGINSILYQLNRGDYLPLNQESMIDPVSFGREKGLETGVYVGSQWEITPLLEVNGGIRFNLYSYLGPGTVYSYLEGYPKTKVNITDTLTYNSNEFIKTYAGVDIRFGAKYLINEKNSIKASYNRLHQYIFLLSNTIAVAPSALWKLSDPHIKPMVGDQYSLGYYSNIFDDNIEFSAEAYYKRVKRLVEYKDGAEFIVNEIPESDIIQGKLDAYGIEFMIKKPRGKLNGWINYTLSKANVVVNDPVTGENNNFGKSYPANWDKPHACNMVVNYRVSRRLVLSGNVVYATGRPITYPTSMYYLNGIETLQYSLRNEYRLPDYFRIDLSVTIEGNLQAKKLAHSSFTFSVYNLTGRNNAYSVYFRTDDKSINAYKLSVFGVPILSITYNLKLGNYAD